MGKLSQIKLPDEITPELSEETGLHIGDGTMNFYQQRNKLKGKYSLRGHIKDDKPHYEGRIKELYKLVYNLDVSLSEMKSTSVFGFQIWSDSLVGFKREILDLPLGEKKEIKIPDSLLKEDLIASVSALSIKIFMLITSFV